MKVWTLVLVEIAVVSLLTYVYIELLVIGVQR